jgi:uncharacterized membrane protein
MLFATIGVLGIVGFVAWAALYRAHAPAPVVRRHTADHALEDARIRFVRGEIDSEQYERIASVLRR